MNIDHFPFLPYGKQSITQEDCEAVAAALTKELITRGPQVEAFEAAVAAYCGAQHAVAFSSGTAALMAAYHVVDIGPFDKVISTPNTFVATIGPAIQKKAVPTFVDIDLKTGSIDLEFLKEVVQIRFSRGKQVIVPVHFAGIALDMRAFDQMLVHPNSLVIEDAAHALGSSYPDGQKVGCCRFSAMTMFSFHPVKNITTGEGGMITTNDSELCHRLKRFRNNGMERETSRIKGEAAPWYYEVQELTGNYHMNEMQAALGLSQLKRLDLMIEKRRALMAVYREQLKGFSEIKLFSEEVDERTAYHLCVVQIDYEVFQTTRTLVMEKLKAKGIGTQVHYIPLYRHPFFKEGSHLNDAFPQMEHYYAQTLTLPLFYEMTEEDVVRVANTLKEVLGIEA